MAVTSLLVFPKMILKKMMVNTYVEENNITSHPTERVARLAMIIIATMTIINIILFFEYLLPIFIFLSYSC